jgi:UDP-glucose 4-epimerase
VPFGLRSVRLRYFNAAGATKVDCLANFTNRKRISFRWRSRPARSKGAARSSYGSDYATPDAACIRDYTHVNDLADAHVRALQYLERSESDKPSDANADDAGSLAVNLGTGRGYSVLEVIQAAERATTGCAARQRRGRPWDGRRGDLDDMVSSAWDWMQKTSGGTPTATAVRASLETSAGAPCRSPRQNLGAMQRTIFSNR